MLESLPWLPHALRMKYALLNVTHRLLGFPLMDAVENKRELQVRQRLDSNSPVHTL
jgi:hypothetical protein